MHSQGNDKYVGHSIENRSTHIRSVIRHKETVFVSKGAQNSFQPLAFDGSF